MPVIIDENRDTQFLINTSNEIFRVPREISFASEGENGIFERAGSRDNEIFVFGDIDVDGTGFAGIRAAGLRTRINLIGDGDPQSSGEGIDSQDIGVDMLGDFQRLFNDTRINADGIGIHATGAAVLIDNDGRIDSATTAIDIGAHAGMARVFNTGFIHADVGMSITGSAVVDNDDTVDGETLGIEIRTSKTQTSEITNTGMISAADGNAALKLGAGQDHVVNTGILNGQVELGGGDDIFEGDTTSAVFGGKGNDTYLISSGNDIFETADNGIDLVKSSATFSLGANFENLTLTGSGNISAFGNSGNNRIIGNAGGGSLVGFEGDDILTGKGGEDTFRFFTGFDHDIITDFKPDIDGINLEDWLAIADFDDLVDNHLRIDGKDLVFKAGGDSLTLKNVKLAEIEASDFMFQS